MTRPAARYRYLDHDGVLAFAHRGGDRVAQENSVAAFADALAQGYRYLETDVHASKDGVVYAFHDDNLQRMTGQDVCLGALRAQQIDAITLHGGHHIPRMAELFERFPEARFNIDAKSGSVVAPLANLINKMRVRDKCCIGAFSDARIKAVRRLVRGDICHSVGPRQAARFYVGAKLYMPQWFSAGCLQFPMMQGNRQLVTPKTIAYAHRCGLQVHAWTINSENTMNELLDMGVDGIMTDDCALLKKVLLARNLW